MTWCSLCVKRLHTVSPAFREIAIARLSLNGDSECSLAAARRAAAKRLPVTRDVTTLADHTKAARVRVVAGVAGEAVAGHRRNRSLRIAYRLPVAGNASDAQVRAVYLGESADGHAR